MPKQAAGIVLYRQGPTSLEVLLVHPSGNYNRGKPWSIPKGLPDEGEDLETTARRETREEAGVDVRGPLVELGSIEYQKSRKQVHGFAAPACDGDAPHCACWEVDQAEFVPIDRARQLIHPDQAPLLDRLLTYLAQTQP